MSPRKIAELQLIAYNNRDLDAFCDLFDKQAVLIDLPSQRVLAQGVEQIRSIYTERFALPQLHCVVHSTSDIADFAIDKETVYGIPGGPVNIVAMYQVNNDKIHRVYFIRETE